jgi:signal transduction histidine kinase
VRGDRSRHSEGSGLGLPIASSLVERMGGSLSLEVDADLFKITLRFALYAPEAEPAPAAEIESPQ